MIVSCVIDWIFLCLINQIYFCHFSATCSDRASSPSSDDKHHITAETATATHRNGRVPSREGSKLTRVRAFLLARLQEQNKEEIKIKSESSESSSNNNNNEVQNLNDTKLVNGDKLDAESMVTDSEPFIHVIKPIEQPNSDSESSEECESSVRGYAREDHSYVVKEECDNDTPVVASLEQECLEETSPVCDMDLSLKGRMLGRAGHMLTSHATSGTVIVEVDQPADYTIPTVNLHRSLHGIVVEPMGRLPSGMHINGLKMATAVTSMSSGYMVGCGETSSLPSSTSSSPHSPDIPAVSTSQLSEGNHCILSSCFMFSCVLHTKNISKLLHRHDCFIVSALCTYSRQLRVFECIMLLLYNIWEYRHILDTCFQLIKMLY